MDNSELVTATPQELTELEKFIKENSDAIAEKFRQMYKEEIIVNGTYPELKWFRETLFVTILKHDSAKSFDDHMEFVHHFLDMMKESMNLTAKHVTPGLKAIEDLFEKYECRQLALVIEKRVEEWKTEEEGKNIEELRVNEEKNK